MGSEGAGGAVLVDAVDAEGGDVAVVGLEFGALDSEAAAVEALVYTGGVEEVVELYCAPGGAPDKQVGGEGCAE